MRLTFFIILSLTLPLHAQSWSPEVFEERVIVTASAVPEELDTVPASATVITREQIELRNALDLEEVLREVPGLFLARAGSAGRQTSVFTRGVNSAQTLVLWNGIEINNPYFSGYDFGQFSTAGVEKVEVVRGPFSSLYGADAVGGVINVITGANQPGFVADLQVGEEGLYNGRAELTGAWDALRADVAVESREDDGFFPNDDFSQFSFLGSTNWSPTDRIVVGLSARHNDYELGIPFDQGAPSLQRRQEGRELQVALPLTLELRGVVVDVTFSRTEHEIDFFDPAGMFGPELNATDSKSDRAIASARFDTRAGTIIAGAEYEDAAVHDETLFGANLDGDERSSRSVFLEDRYSTTVAAGDLELSAGLRYDDYEEFGSETSPRVGLAWSRGGFTLRTAYGESFRAPSVGDLYYPFYGNPELGAETSQSWELGGSWSRAGLSASATLFHNDIEDLISFDPSTNRAENVGRARTQGVELGATATLGNVRLNGTWTILDTEDRGTGLDLLRRPSRAGTLSAHWQREALSVMLSALYAGERDDVQPFFPFSRVPSDSYLVSDLDLAYELGSFRPYLRVENLFDESYQEVLGFPAPPRRIILGLRYSR